VPSRGVDWIIQYKANQTRKNLRPGGQDAVPCRRHNRKLARHGVSGLVALNTARPEWTAERRKSGTLKINCHN